MQWYYSKGAVQLGPVSESEILAKIAAGEITAADRVWRDGMPDWVPLSKVPELAAKSQTVVSAPPPISSQASPYTTPAATPLPTFPAQAGQQIPTYLWQSIVVTLFCCIPFGIVAIVKASKVGNLQAQGDIQGALDASKSAKKWITISIAIGLTVVLLQILLVAFTSHTSSPSPLPAP